MWGRVQHLRVLLQNPVGPAGSVDGHVLTGVSLQQQNQLDGFCRMGRGDSRQGHVWECTVGRVQQPMCFCAGGMQHPALYVAE